MKNNCEEIRDNISAYLDGELYLKDRTDFEGHMSSCEDCKDLLAQTKKIIDELNGLPEIDLPENFHKDFMKKLSYVGAPPIDLMTRQRLLKAKSAKTSRLKIVNMRKHAMLAASVLLGFVVVSAVGSIIGNNLANPSSTAEKPSMAQMSADRGLDTSAGTVTFAENYSLDENSSVENSSAESSSRKEAPMHSSSSALPAPAAAIAQDQLTEPLATQDYFIKTFNINIEPEDFDTALASLDNLPGYNSESDIMKNDGYSRDYARITRRVTLSDYETTKNILSGVGKIISQSESEEKLNDALSSLNIKLKAKDTELTRLNALLEKSDSVDVLAAVSRRISEVSSERDNIKGNIISYESQAGSPYVNIVISPGGVDIPVPEDYLTFGDKIKNSFIRSSNICLAVMEGFLIFLSTAAIPILIILFAVGVYFTVRRARNERDEN